ncbi:hypothetical protein V6N13_077825 [Hibiscus sabdariffa]
MNTKLQKGSFQIPDRVSLSCLAVKSGCFRIRTKIQVNKLGWGHFSTVWLAWDTQRTLMLWRVQDFASLQLSFRCPSIHFPIRDNFLLSRHFHYDSFHCGRIWFCYLFSVM